MPHITLDGQRIPMRPIRARDMIDVDDARAKDDLAASAALIRAVADAVPPDRRDAVLDMDPRVVIDLFSEWTTSTEDDALPPGSGTSSGTP